MKELRGDGAWRGGREEIGGERGHSANHESVLGVGEGRHHINGRCRQMYIFFARVKSAIDLRYDGLP